MWVYNVMKIYIGPQEKQERTKTYCHMSAEKKPGSQHTKRNKKNKANHLGLSCRLTDDDPGSAAEIESKTMKAQPGCSRLRTET